MRYREGVDLRGRKLRREGGRRGEQVLHHRRWGLDRLERQQESVRVQEWGLLRRNRAGQGHPPTSKREVPEQMPRPLSGEGCLQENVRLHRIDPQEERGQVQTIYLHLIHNIRTINYIYSVYPMSIPDWTIGTKKWSRRGSNPRPLRY